jgi:hypothetical protein
MSGTTKPGYRREVISTTVNHRAKNIPISGVIDSLNLQILAKSHISAHVLQNLVPPNFNDSH